MKRSFWVLTGCLAMLSTAVNAEFNPVQKMTREQVKSSGFVPDLDEIAKHELGSVDNPVKSYGKKGQRNYIENLDCVNGAIPEYKRDGSAGIGPHGYQMDKYVLRCDGDDSVEIYEIYMDLYHEKTEVEPVKGFTTWL